MASVTIKTRAPKAPGSTEKDVVSHECEFDFGDSPDNTISKFGLENTVNSAIESWIIDLQAGIRARLNAGNTEEEINDFVANWEPGKKMPRVAADPKTRLLSGLKKLSAEERRELLEALEGAAV